MLFINYRPRYYAFFMQKTRILKRGMFKSGGRNVFGRITAFHRGGGNKRRYRMLDFWRRINSCGYVIRIEYDSVRSAKIGLILYLNGYMSYILMPESLLIGSKVFSGSDFDVAKGLYISERDYIKDILKKTIFSIGNAMPLGYMPVGSLVYSIELYPSKGSQICRAAGASAVILKKTDSSVLLKLRSGWKLLVSSKCFATFGIASNMQNKYFIKGKAGTMRNRGFRPVVRGVAMNPIDHPHGGGQGKTSGGKKPLSP